MCWTMCAEKSWSARESIGESSAATTTNVAAMKQHSRQTGASAAARGEPLVRTARQRRV